MADRFEQPDIEALNKAPDYFKSRPPANIQLTLRRVNENDRLGVPFRVNSSGLGKNLVVWFVGADIDLLEAKEVRLERAKQFVDWMAAQGTDDARSRLLQMGAGRERLIAYFEEQYINNPPGEYEIVARYFPTTTGNWKGSLVSAPFRLTVVSGADFFEDMKARLASGGRR